MTGPGHDTEEDYNSWLWWKNKRKEEANMPMQGSFNAQEFAPKQVGTSHPTGDKFPANISNTSIEPTKDGDGGMFIVEFTTPAGSIAMRYNLWNKSAQAVAIAKGQLSALCHATGVFKLDWQNDGAALRNAQCQIDVGDQIDKQTKLPNGYTQITKVYDRNGNEPGKPPSQAQVQPQQGQPAQAWQQPGAQAPQGQPAWSQGPSVAGNAAAPPWAQNK